MLCGILIAVVSWTELEKKLLFSGCRCLFFLKGLKGTESMWGSVINTFYL